MKTWFVCIGALVCAVSSFGDDLRYAPGVITLKHSKDYLDANPAPDYWALSPFYAGQQTSSDCSAATLTMAINGFLRQPDQPISEDELIKRVADDEWTDAVQQGGAGTNLKKMAVIAKKALAAYGLYGTVDKVIEEDDSDESLARLREVLTENERSASDFLLANFDQGIFTGDYSVGHFSPIAAYDADRHRVLLLDVDRASVEPYWVPDSLFLRGMAKFDPVKRYHRGYLHIRVTGRAGR